MSEDLEFLKELIKGFLAEADDLFSVVENRITGLQANPQDAEAIEDLYEACHTIRMQAGFLDFDSLSEVALGMEPMLDQVRQGALTLDESTVALLLEAQGSLEDGISQLRAFDISPLDVGDLLERLQVAATGEAAPAAPAATEAPPEESPAADGEPSPEAQIAATTSAGNPNDLPQHGG
jgi:two-component system chemotaxis sensor kinase CheA